MSDPALIAPGWLIPAGIGGVALMKAWDWFLSRKSTGAAENGYAELINGLRTEVNELRDRLTAAEVHIETEVKARRKADATAHRLQLRINTLEAVMEKHGIPIPAHVAHFALDPEE